MRARCRIDQLAIARQEASLRQLQLNRFEDRVGAADLQQRLLKRPERLCIGNPPRRLHPQKTLIRHPVQHLELQLVVRQPLQLLEHQHFDHQYHRIRRTAAFGVVHHRQQGLYAVGNRYKIHLLVHQHQGVANPIQRAHAFVAGKQTGRHGKFISTH